MGEVWTADKTENGRWIFSWDGDSPDTFDIWLEGELLDTVEGGYYEFPLPGYETTPPPIEVVSDDSYTEAENEIYPPYATLQWREVSGASGYKVKRYVSGSWTNQVTIRETDLGWYVYKTVVVEDQTQEQFRVYAINENDDEGTPVTFTFTLTRNPSEPDVEYDINSIGDLVVTEA